MNKTQPTEQKIDQLIQKHLKQLSKPGVLTVRPGYEITGHQLTGKSAVVATVHTKTNALATAARLPDKIAGVPVDVRQATPHQRLRAHDPLAAELTQTFGRPQDIDPVWPLEREIPSGKRLTAPASRHQTLLQTQKASQAAVAQAVSAQVNRPEVPYVPAPGRPLIPMQVTATITAHVSPDAGFAKLSQFLAATQKSLVIGMYDFTSGPILDLFKTDLTGAKTLQMVLDNPPPDDTRNQTDAVTVQELNAALGGRSHIVRAASRPDTLTSAWIFPYAYHIKVIVRDNAAFWLSSGNLNNSNQPDPAALPQKEDRDWHVIVEHPGLAQLFAAYLDQDFQSAAPLQVTGDGLLGAAVSDAHAKLALDSDPPPPALAATVSRFPAQVFSQVTALVTPLLTPDPGAAPAPGQYVTAMTKLISGARKKLYIQLQYIESSGSPGDYESLLQVIAGRVAAGVDVRLIESLEYGEKWAEKMKSVGVDLTANIALQPNVHNKGFVVDSAAVVVSSQNFSPAGVRTNRDAGLIIESAPIAQYFEKIFLSDWNTRSKPFTAKAARTHTKGTAPKAAKVAKKKAAKKSTPRRATTG
jgi:phosphatidylserine/phosphatidylglycerophosphate/cardiolipin synthase-like enzyme